MGNKSSRSRSFVDEKYTRPQGTFDLNELDGRKLRRLILNRKLAPCFPGAEECTSALDECPICLLSYPSLNRSTCCSKPICTECYLRIKLEHLSCPPQCPFCKTSSYAVDYYGAKTVEERGIEQAEEQKVIETLIRIHQEELHDEKKVRRGLIDDASAEASQGETNHTPMEPGFEVDCARSAQAAHMQGSLCEIDDRGDLSNHRDDSGDLELEEMMLMEALWLSMQEHGQTREDFFPAHQTPTSGTLHEDGIFNSNGMSAEMAERCEVIGGLSRTHEESQATMAEGSVWNGSCQAVEAAGPLPTSFEDQIRLAMSLSLAEVDHRVRPE